MRFGARTRFQRTLAIPGRPGSGLTIQVGESTNWAVGQKLLLINDGTPAGAINYFQPGCRVERSLLRYLAGNGFCGTPAAR
jgi:hypothetical protein